MIQVSEQARAVDPRTHGRQVLLTDSNDDFRFAACPETLDPDSNEYRALHDVEFVVINARSRQQAVKKLEQFIEHLRSHGATVADEE